MGFSNSTTNKVYAKLKTDVSDKAVSFYISKKDGDSWMNTDPSSNFTGRLVGFKFSTYEWKKKSMNKVEMVFDDAGQEVVISMSLSGLAKSIINTLSSRTDLYGLPISMSVWGSERNGNWNANIALRTGDEKLGWKFSWDELNKSYGKKYGAEWFKNDDLWIAMGEKFITPQFEGKTPIFDHTEAPQVPIVEEFDDDDSSLPF